MKYNRALDHMLEAATAYAAGDHAEAAENLHAATQQPDFEDAQRILEASNAKAFAELQASLKKPETPAQKRITAAKEVKAEFEEHQEPDGDEAPGAVDGEEVVKTEEPAEEQLAGDLSELEDVAEDVSEELEVEDEGDPAEQFAAVLASMQRKAGRK